MSYIEFLKRICREKEIEINDFKDITPFGGIVASYPNILSILNPNIRQNKEGLINWNTLISQYIKKDNIYGFLYDTDYMIMVHPFFRREFTINSNFAPHFIILFWELNKPELELYIAIDFDNVRITVDDSMYLEEDTWYGAKFTNKISQISDGNSKHCIPTDIKRCYLKLFFNNAYSLITSWETKDKIKEFQAEEFKTQEVNIKIGREKYYPARYIHAEFD